MRYIMSPPAAAAFCVMLASSVAAQAPAPILQEPQTIPLWQTKAPGQSGEAPEDIPTLTIYMPASTTGPMKSPMTPKAKAKMRALL